MSGAIYVFDECAQPRCLSKLLVMNFIIKIWDMRYEDENKTSKLYQIPWCEITIFTTIPKTIYLILANEIWINMIQECWRLHHQQGVIWLIYFAICCYGMSVKSMKDTVQWKKPVTNVWIFLMNEFLDITWYRLS